MEKLKVLIHLKDGSVIKTACDDLKICGEQNYTAYFVVNDGLICMTIPFENVSYTEAKLNTYENDSKDTE